MLEWLFSRQLVIALAVIGGAISLFISWSKSRNMLNEQQLAWLNKASYAFMGASIILFIGAGLFIA